MTRSILRPIHLLPILGGAALLAWSAISHSGITFAAATSTDSASATQTAVAHSATSPDPSKFEAYFVPSGAFEVRCNPREYHDELRVKSAAQPGDVVAKGAVLLQLDTQKIDSEVAKAQNELAIAQVNLAKAQSDISLGEKADAVAMDTSAAALSDAQTALKRWDGLDGNAFLMASQLGSHQADYEVENASDELAELKKMYKSEDLTGSTEEIVMKRATHSLELQKVAAALSHAATDKTRDFDAMVKREQLSQAVDQQAVAVHQLTAAQAQAKSLRQTSLVAAQDAADDATRTLADLQFDRQNFTVTSPTDGVVVYGVFDHGAWQQPDHDSLIPDEKIETDKVLMTVFTPAKLRLNVECPESRLTEFSTGAKMTVVADALPQLSYVGTCAKIPAVGRLKDSKRIFDIVVDLPATDPRLAPGFGARVSLNSATTQN
jgi:multidrug efflux pump subunit AcrA (membrane-fusion protein)